MKKFTAMTLAIILVCGCLMACAGGANNPIVGTWTLTRAKALGMEFTADTLGIDMQLIFKADGSATMINDGETIEGASWSYSDNTVKLKADGEELYDLVYDGTALTLHEPESGSDLIFEKK